MHVRDTRLPAQSVRRIVMRRCAAVGLDPERFSAYSLRGDGDVRGVGCRVDVADRRPRPLAQLERLSGYVRDGRALDHGNPLRATGL